MYVPSRVFTLISSMSDLLIFNLFVSSWNVFGAMAPLQFNTTASNSTFSVLCVVFIPFIISGCW